MDETKAALMIYGDLENKWVVTELSPVLGVFELKTKGPGRPALCPGVPRRVSISGGPQDARKGLGAMSPDYFKRLNRDSDTLSLPSPSFLRVLDYSASFMWQSFNSERAGSHISRVKHASARVCSRIHLINLSLGRSITHRCTRPTPCASCRSGARRGTFGPRGGGNNQIEPIFAFFSDACINASNFLEVEVGLMA